MRPVNLLPQDHRPLTGGGLPGSAYAVVGAFAALFVAALLYVLTVNDVNSTTEEIARVQTETQAAQQRAAGLSAYATFASLKQTRVASVTALAQQRIDWERLMRELSRVIPQSTYVKSIEASSGAGGGASGTPTLKLAGCAQGGHREVADLLVRLRKLYRAQDVQLRDSSKSGSGGSGNCAGRGASFSVEVTFTPQAPGSEIPRGESKVPAALGGGS